MVTIFLLVGEIDYVMNGLTPKQKGMVVKRMDRENLIRGKRTDNREWVEGFNLPIGQKAYVICKAATECMDGENTDLYATEWYEVDPETVCQYTGLPDKNEKKIFEGDIVKEVDSGDIGIVKFGVYDLKHYGFYVEWMRNCQYREDIYFWSKNCLIQVIGNIFDNHELIGG